MHFIQHNYPCGYWVVSVLQMARYIPYPVEIYLWSYLVGDIDSSLYKCPQLKLRVSYLERHIYIRASY